MMSPVRFARALPARLLYHLQEPIRLRALTVELGERTPRAEFI